MSWLEKAADSGNEVRMLDGAIKGKRFHLHWPLLGGEFQVRRLFLNLADMKCHRQTHPAAFCPTTFGNSRSNASVD